MLTQTRQAPGAWGQDQDNYEDALPVEGGWVGVFSETCKIDTPNAATVETTGAQLAAALDDPA